MQGQLITYEVHEDTLKIENSKNYYIVYNLKGDLKCLQGEETFLLKENDVVIVNSMQTLEILEACVYVLFTIDYFILKKFYHNRTFFFCNSSVDKNDNYSLLIKLLNKFIAVSFEENEFSKVELYKNECELLIFIVNNFALSQFLLSTNNKSEDIIDYIDSHYNEDLSLNEMSELFNFTPQYFSKYFKEQNGITFYKYLSNIRLEHACNDLIVSSKSLLHVALDNGFPNVDSFNKLFVKSYGMKPSDYRKKYNQKNTSVSIEQSHVLKEMLQKKTEEKMNANMLIMDIDASKTYSFNPCWGKFINLHDMDCLNDFDIQQQLSKLQEGMHYRYLRIHLNIPNKNEIDPFFYREERYFDFLIKNNFILWLVIDYRHITNIEDVCDYLKLLLSHFANRYSIDNVSKWKFELSYRTSFTQEKCEKYFFNYHKIKNVIEQYQCIDALYGPELVLGYEQGSRIFINYMIAHNIYFHKMTFIGEPFQYYEGEDGLVTKRVTDINFVKNKILGIKKDFPNLNQCAKSIYIVNWDDNLIKKNPLNDSSYRAAYIINNMIECYGEIEGLSYGLPLDLMSGNNESRDVLSGNNGLISVHGILKPSYYAYNFLQKMGSTFVKKDSHSLVSDANNRNYVIVAHNCKRLNHRYYLFEENLDEVKVEEYFDDYDAITLQYHLNHINNGTYLIKIRSISSDDGSVQDKVYTMRGDSRIPLSESELNYLKQTCVPSMAIKQVMVDDNTLSLSLNLKANEIKHIHIIYLY